MKFLKLSIIAVIMIWVHTTTEGIAQTQSIYDIKINQLNGDPLNLGDFKGKKILFVNVASKCGYTPQYEDLQLLSEDYKNKLVIIGVPSNQFNDQEPGTPEEIAEFCKANYGVTFPLTEKINVKPGRDQHPLYQWLTKKSKNGFKDSYVKWNFQKYMVNETGQLTHVFYSGTKPFDKAITNVLGPNPNE